MKCSKQSTQDNDCQQNQDTYVHDQQKLPHETHEDEHEIHENKDAIDHANESFHEDEYALEHDTNEHEIIHEQKSVHEPEHTYEHETAQEHENRQDYHKSMNETHEQQIQKSGKSKDCVDEVFDSTDDNIDKDDNIYEGNSSKDYMAQKQQEKRR